jgi:HSP20 family molecular chaperone IbpA
MKAKKLSQSQQSDSPTALLIPRNADDLRWEMQTVQLAITRRAYELFEARGPEHGHDWEDWFRAESEILSPVSVSISETDDWISVRVNVFGFEANELRVGIEPRRITILGNKVASVTESEVGKAEYIDLHPHQILKLVDLATDVMPEMSVVELQAGLLKFELPKAARHQVDTAAIAA